MNLDQHKLASALQKQALGMVDDNSALEQKVEEIDFKEAIVRILWKEDWTDKIAHRIGRIRGVFHRRVQGTELSDEIRSLVSDPRDIEAAYVEMNEGYKEFLRAIWEAGKQGGWRE